MMVFSDMFVSNALFMFMLRERQRLSPLWTLSPSPMGDDYDEDFEDYEAGARSVRP